MTSQQIGRLLLLTGFSIAVGFMFENIAAGIAAFLGVNIVTIIAREL